MNHSRNRIFCFFLAFLMLLSTFCACSTAEPEPTAVPTVPSPIREEKELLLTNWEAYLAAMETVYTQMNWVFDYVDTFAQDNNWESLLKARAACTAAVQNLYTFSPPELSLSDEQIRNLEDGGIEADVVKAEYLALRESLQSDIETLESLNMILHNDVFYSPIASELDTWVQTHRSIIDCLSAYLCATTNYLLLQLQMPEVWDQLPNSYPTICSRRTGWSNDPDALMEDAMLSLDQYEALFVRMNEFYGLSEYILQLTIEALETQNLDYLAREIHIIDHVPFYLPTPDWLPADSLCFYLTKSPDTGESAFIQSGEAIDLPPSILYISCPGVSFEEVEAYITQLERWDYHPYAGWTDETQSAYQIFIATQETSVLIEWSPDRTLYYASGSLMCLAPELYLLAHSYS